MTESEQPQQVPMTAQFASLLDRYKTDKRFEGREAERQDAIITLTNLNNFVQHLLVPQGAIGILLIGSYSHYKSEEPPRPGKPIISPFRETKLQGGSDLDLIFEFSTSKDAASFIDNDNDLVIIEEARKMGFDDIADKLEIHSIPYSWATRAISHSTRRFFRNMRLTATLLKGVTNLKDLGERRDTGVKFRRPEIDGTIDIMGGGF